jgi:hypothetical protein
VQSPRYVALCPVEEIPIYFSADAVTPENWGVVSDASMRHKFKINFAVLMSAADVPAVGEAQVGVILDVIHRGHTRLESRSREIPLLQYLQQVPESGRAVASGDTEAKPSSKKKSLLDQFPWLLDYERKLDFFASSDSKSKKKTYSDSSVQIDDDLGELCEDDLDAALDELHLAREALMGDQSELVCEDFKPRVLGGKWLVRHSGKPFDAIQGSCKNPESEEFSERRLGTKTMRFTISLGIKNAGVLARAWCSRLQYFYDVERADEHGALAIFNDAHRASYVEPLEFVQLADSLPSAELRARIDKIRNLFA